MKSFKMTLSVAAAAVLMTAASVFAIDSAQSGDWNTGSTWVGGVVPTSTAVIKATHTVTVSSGYTASISTLTVEDASSGSPAVLSMEAGGLLQVSSGIVVEDVDAVHGVFKFNASSGIAPQLRTNASAPTLTGQFQVIGSVGGVINRSSTQNFQLTSGSTITASGGPLDINCPMTVAGLIKVDGATSITFHFAPSASSSGKLEVSGDNAAQMIFDFADTINVTSALDLKVTQGQVIMRADSQLHLSGGGLKLEASGSIMAEPGSISALPGKLEVSGTYAD